MQVEKEVGDNQETSRLIFQKFLQELRIIPIIKFMKKLWKLVHLVV